MRSSGSRDVIIPFFDNESRGRKFNTTKSRNRPRRGRGAVGLAYAKSFGCQFGPEGLIYIKGSPPRVALAMPDPNPSLVERLFSEHGAALQSFFRRRVRTKSGSPDLVQ